MREENRHKKDKRGKSPKKGEHRKNKVRKHPKRKRTRRARGGEKNTDVEEKNKTEQKRSN